jgi:hypothetical protein
MDINEEIISDEDAEDAAIGQAIIEGATGEYIDTSEFLKSLRAG